MVGETKEEQVISDYIVKLISNQNTKKSKGIIIGIRGGIKLPEEIPKIDSGPWFGLYINMPTGSGWSLQLEHNVWKVSLLRAVQKQIFFTEWAFLVAYNKYFNNIYLQLLLGPGILTSGESWIGGDRDFLFSFNVATSIGIAVSERLECYIQIRNQRAGGSERSYTPWLIGLGLQFRTN